MELHRILELVERTPERLTGKPSSELNSMAAIIERAISRTERQVQRQPELAQYGNPDVRKYQAALDVLNDEIDLKDGYSPALPRALPEPIQSASPPQPIAFNNLFRANYENY